MTQAAGGDEERRIMESDKISEAAKALRGIQQAVSYFDQLIVQKESETQDLLHQIELGDKRDRNRAATALKNVRRERRAAKDYLRQYQPIVKYIADNPDILKKLDRLVGELRKAEKPIEGRRYYPRVLDVPIGRDSH